MPGQRIKMDNGYQYMLGNKFPFQYKYLEVPVKRVKKQSVKENVEVLEQSSSFNIDPPQIRCSSQINHIRSKK